MLKRTLRHCIVATTTTMSLLTVACPSNDEPDEPEPTPEAEPTVDPCDGHDGGDGTCLPVGDCIEGFQLLPSGRCGGWIKVGDLDAPSGVTKVTPTASGALLSGGTIFNAFGDASTTGTLYAYESATQSLRQLNSEISPRRFHSAVEVDGDKVLVMGGVDDTNNSVRATEWVDVTADNVETRATLPEGKTGIEAYIVDGEVLCLDGQPTTGENWSYNIEGNSWSSLPRLKKSVIVAGYVQFGDGRVGILGGYDNGLMENSDAFDVFDPVSSTWTEYDDVLSPGRRGHYYAAEGSGLFVAGGYAQDSEGTAQVLATAAYSPDPTTTPFTALPPLPGPGRWFTGNAESLGDGEFLVVGGAFDDVLEYSPRPQDGTSFVYNVDSGEMVQIESLPFRSNLFYSTARLYDGSVMAAGGVEMGLDSTTPVSRVDVFRVGKD